MEKDVYIKKYPRTYHFPFSPGKGADDKVNFDWENDLTAKDLIYTEKLDGGNTQITQYGIYARSINSVANHPSFDYLKQKHATFKKELGDLVIYGENLYAIHSIEYTNLTSFFYVFAVRKEDEWLSWEDVNFWAKYFDFLVVPELIPDPKLSIEENVKNMAKLPSMLGGEREGLVVRSKSSFDTSLFKNNVVKYVRANHVQTKDHWTKSWKPAKLAP